MEPHRLLLADRCRCSCWPALLGDVVLQGIQSGFGSIPMAEAEPPATTRESRSKVCNKRSCGIEAVYQQLTCCPWGPDGSLRVAAPWIPPRNSRTDATNLESILGHAWKLPTAAWSNYCRLAIVRKYQLNAARKLFHVLLHTLYVGRAGISVDVSRLVARHAQRHPGVCLLHTRQQVRRATIQCPSQESLRNVPRMQPLVSSWRCWLGSPDYRTNDRTARYDMDSVRYDPIRPCNSPEHVVPLLAVLTEPRRTSRQPFSASTVAVEETASLFHHNRRNAPKHLYKCYQPRVALRWYLTISSHEASIVAS